MSIHMGHIPSHSFPIQKSLYPFFPDFLVTNFPIMTLPIPSATPLVTAHELDLYLWPFFLSSRMNSQVHCSGNSAHWECFPSVTNALQGCPRRELQSCTCPLWRSACILCRTFYKPGPSFPQSTDHGDLCMKPEVQAGREKAMWQHRDCGYAGHVFV